MTHLYTNRGAAEASAPSSSLPKVFALGPHFEGEWHRAQSRTTVIIVGVDESIQLGNYKTALFHMLGGIGFVGTDSDQFLRAYYPGCPALAPPSRKSWLDTVLERVAYLEKLESNWDGYGASAIEIEIVHAANDLSRWLEGKISAPPIVVPLSNGYLQFEWHDDSRTLELEFESPEKIHYLKWNPETGEEDEEVISIQDRLEIIKLLRWFDRGLKHG